MHTSLSEMLTAKKESDLKLVHLEKLVSNNRLSISTLDEFRHEMIKKEQHLRIEVAQTKYLTSTF